MAAQASRLATFNTWPRRAALWLEWVVLTTAGWAAGSLLVFAALAWSTGLADAFLHTSLGSAVLGAVFGLALGAAQSLVLSRLSLPARIWLPATAGIWAAAWAVGQTLTNLLLDSYSLLAFVPGGLAAALVASLAQWLVMRRYAHRASAWLVATLLGWSPAAVVCMYGGGALLAAGLAALIGPMAWLLALLPGVFAAILTGIALLALL